MNSRWFTHETASFYTEWCTTLTLFHNFEVSQGTHNHSFKNYGFQFGTPFSLYACALKDHLAMKRKLLLKIAKLEIQSVYIPGHGIEEPVYIYNIYMHCVVKKRLRWVPIVNMNMNE